MHAVGVDVGGTFTDFVAIDAAGKIFTAKVPSTPHDQSEAVVEGLGRLAEQMSTDVEQFMSECEYLVHGTTVATNIMLEMNGANTGILTTKGFRDILDLRRNYKEAAFDLRLQPPYPIVPRRKRMAVSERIDYAGNIVEPLNEDDVRSSVESLLKQEVESIVVCYLFSFLNPVHEIRTREIIKEMAPNLHISLSHEILPRVREFERLSTTVVDAYVTPKLSRYLMNLKTRLESKNFNGDIFIMSANGGMLPIEQAAKSGVNLVLSGPAGGVVAGAQIGLNSGNGNVITVDMGGTSYDVCLIKNGLPTVSTEAWMNRYRIAVPTLDIHTIGAGGGSIASVDEAGRLTVGPASAGAVPGPACFGRGGKLPTVTDANLYLGLLDANSFLGGKMKLDYEAAAKAIEEHVAKPMGISTVEAANGIFRVVNNSMNNGIRKVSISQGYDPRDFDLIAFGGAGAIHAARQATELGMKRVLVPKGNASVLCAMGDVMSDVLISKTRGYFSRSSMVNLEQVNRLIQDAIAEGSKEIDGIRSLGEVKVVVKFEMHYAGQTHEIVVEGDTTAEGYLKEEGMQNTIQRFHDMHKQLYSFNKPEEETEILGIQVDLWGIRSKLNVKTDAVSDNDTSRIVKGTRKVFYEEYNGFVDTPVYDGERMVTGDRIEGPAIIEEPHTTIVVIPGSYVVVSPEQMYEMIL
ncbi:hydantoinase/oxoprolinase family protein [Paenibacillus xylaniclasticus]|uniref:hydantoinase/oxoprolinase family protein n=1 Tax=Paenibacillus xylaniclasticus TaxID=588083 RepID=UPI0013E032F3|nr:MULTISPECIES: hydantoinase/oxoprolinase family protein [Paenibacillus]GFN30071.1 N-methylhydantoinase A [Paenibacillus curdlanolyticus]